MIKVTYVFKDGSQITMQLSTLQYNSLYCVAFTRNIWIHNLTNSNVLISNYTIPF